jgi:predicted  nucleic acid-binding Zn-ribbon protein
LIIRMISVESHSKQIKLLNEYIVALEKQTAAARKENEEHLKGSSQTAEDVRVMNEEINKLRN